VTASVEDVLKPTISGYFVSGLAGVLVGWELKRFGDEFNGVKYYAAVTPLEYTTIIGPAIVSDIRRREKDKVLARPLVLTGHSYGCAVVTAAARSLSESNKGTGSRINIDALICLDGPKAPIPENVLKADNIRPKTGRISVKMTREKGNTTTDIQEHVVGNGHISLAGNPEVHQIIRDRILR